MWDTECQKAFENIKQYPTNPPILAAPISSKLLLLYVGVMDHASGALLAQTNEKEYAQVTCYLS